MIKGVIYCINKKQNKGLILSESGQTYRFNEDLSNKLIRPFESIAFVNCKNKATQIMLVRENCFPDISDEFVRNKSETPIGIWFKNTLQLIFLIVGFFIIFISFFVSLAIKSINKYEASAEFYHHLIQKVCNTLNNGVCSEEAFYVMEQSLVQWGFLIFFIALPLIFTLILVRDNYVEYYNNLFYVDHKAALKNYQFKK